MVEKNNNVILFEGLHASGLNKMETTLKTAGVRLGVHKVRARVNFSRLDGVTLAAGVP